MVADVLKRRLIFVGGKGGVGKTLVSQAIAQSLPGKVLWVVFEDPLRAPNELIQKSSKLWHFNCEAGASFEEYVALKISFLPLAKLFLSNKLIRYLAKAAPGIHELVLLGKVWHDRVHYDHVVCDMPSTGYGLAMFKSMENFSSLFQGGPIQRDAEKMIATFNDPKECGQLIVSLPEEMPLVESLELRKFLLELFPGNEPALLVNRLMPGTDVAAHSVGTPDSWPSPVASSPENYLRKRLALEKYNLRIWDELGLNYGRLNYVPPSPEKGPAAIIDRLSEQLSEKGMM